MATTRTVGLVAVGVDDTGVLRKLAGAASGAAQLSEWVRLQAAFGVDPVIELLTDAQGKRVAARDVQDAVKRLIDRGDLDLLILYFGGHGIVKAGGDEQVLLSDVGRYKDEAISIAPTVANAWYSTVPNVVLISDACRNAVDPFGPLGTVAGKPALERSVVVGARKSKVDVFYATEQSQTAKEFNGEGFFTQVLLDVLRRPPEDAYELRAGLEPGVAVMPAWSLETCLSVQVPLRAEQQTPPFSQIPDCFVTSRIPQFFGYAAIPPSRAKSLRGNRGVNAPGRLEMLADTAQLRRDALDQIAIQITAPSPLRNKAIYLHDAGLALQPSDFVENAQGRLAFETGTGYSIVGESLDHVLLSGGARAEVIDGHDGRVSSDVRFYPHPFAEQPQRGSAALIFRGGTVCIVPIMPGYIGTVRLFDGQVASLTFEVSAQYISRLGTTDADLDLLAERRLMASALAAAGKLQLLAADEGRQLARFLRQSKRPDPTLGIYSAYAYSLSGDEGGAHSVFRWMHRYRSLDPDRGLPAAPVPFDVAMLAGQITPDGARELPGFAPFCPMMTLGWSMLDAYVARNILHPAIIDAGRVRLNAEWTSFRARDVRSLLTAFERGDLQ